MPTKGVSLLWLMLVSVGHNSWFRDILVSQITTALVINKTKVVCQLSRIEFGYITESE